MPSLTIEQFADVVELQIRQYIKTDYVSLLTDLQDHPLVKALLNKARMSKPPGTSEQAEGVYWKLRMRTAGSYRHISATTPDEVNITQDFVGASAPWKKTEVKYAYVQEEMDFNQGENQIIDLIKAREQGCAFDFVEGLERDGWAFPSASDTLAFFSIPYWITKNATQGFNGGIPTGYSTVGGLSPTTWPRWNNYTGLYVNVSLDDLISLMRDMADETAFKPPVPGVPSLGEPSGPAKAYFTTRIVRKRFADVADARNDNLGPDVSAMDGKVVFRGAEIMWVPVLDADSTAPLYQIDWNTFKYMVKTGWFQRVTRLVPYPGQRNQVAVFKDTYSNFVCFNRRANGVLATGVGYQA